jgi:hypothetical protein
MVLEFSPAFPGGGFQITLKSPKKGVGFGGFCYLSGAGMLWDKKIGEVSLVLPQLIS